jgi:hypothetical protein
MADAPRKKTLEELKAEAIAGLERRGLNVRGNARTDQKITEATFQKNEVQIKQELAGG